MIVRIFVILALVAGLWTSAALAGPFEDGAEAYLLLAEHLARHPEISGEAYNFSYETRETVLEIVKRILLSMDSNLEPQIKNEVTNEIRCQSLDAGKARRELGWKPLFNMENGLKKTISWYRDYFKE